MDEDAVEVQKDASPPTGEASASSPMFGGMSPSEAARKRWERVRQQRAEAEEQGSEDTRPLELDGSTFREKLGIALASLQQDDLNAVVQRMARQAKQGEERSAHVLVRLADQAFGRMGQAPEEQPGGEETWEGMSREKRTALAARFLREAEELDQALAAPAAGTPRSDEPHARVTPGGPPASDLSPDDIA